MVVTFTVGSLPTQIPANDYIQDSIFGGLNQIEWVQYNYVPFSPIDYTHNPSEWRMYFGFTMNVDDEILVSVKVI